MRVLVTGASAGIGGAICKRLARNAKRDGKTLQIAASEYAQTPDNDAIRIELEDMGAKVITPYADLSDPNGPT
jgi:NAD(P)-dependent dehydrogenase (short-subunit alcohol dehydrogenase family)